MSVQIIKSNGDTKQLQASPTLEEARKHVGGWVESLSCGNRGSMQMLMNEEGLSERLPPNPKASKIAGRRIVGDVVILTGKHRWK